MLQGSLLYYFIKCDYMAFLHLVKVVRDVFEDKYQSTYNDKLCYIPNSWNPIFLLLLSLLTLLLRCISKKKAFNTQCIKYIIHWHISQSFIMV